MSETLLKESEVRKRAKRSVDAAHSILEKNTSNIKPETADLIKDRLRQTEKALENGSAEDILTKTEKLENAYDDHLSGFGKSKLRQNIESLLVAIVLALLIRTFIVQPFKIPSGSMIPTLLVGDHLLVNKFVYGTKVPFSDMVVLPFKDIERGDVIVFKYPNPENDPSQEGIDYIKRVVGLPGDSIDLRGENLYINGEKAPLKFLGSLDDERTGAEYDEYEENLFGNRHLVIYQKGQESTYTGSYLPADRVPEGHIFAMGDNRDNSRDSRFWGFVPMENVVGKAFIIHWSWDWDDEGLLDKVRWNRLFTQIR